MGQVRQLRVVRTHKQTVLQSTDKNEALWALDQLEQTPDWILMLFANMAKSPDVAHEALRRLLAQESKHGVQHVLNKLTALELMLRQAGSQGHEKVKVGVDMMIHEAIKQRDQRGN
jgi:hypothetical protein